MEYSSGCCCTPSLCPCSLAYTSITAKWSGSITLDPMTCQEYNRQNLQVRQNTGFDQSSCRLGSRFEPMGAILYPSISHTFNLIPGQCTYTTLRTLIVSHRSRYTFPQCQSPSNPFGYPCEPGLICANELVYDAFHRIYQLEVSYGMVLSLPRRAIPPFPDRPKWGVTIQFGGGAEIIFQSTDPDWTCTPSNWSRISPGFETINRVDGANCWPIMSLTPPNDLTPDPDWSTYIHPVATCYTLKKNFGSVQVG